MKPCDVEFFDPPIPVPLFRPLVGAPAHDDEVVLARVVDIYLTHSVLGEVSYAMHTPTVMHEFYVLAVKRRGDGWDWMWSEFRKATVDHDDPRRVFIENYTALVQ